MAIKEVAHVFQRINSALNRKNLASDGGVADRNQVESLAQLNAMLNSLSFVELLQLSREGLLLHYVDSEIAESVQFGLAKKHRFQLLIHGAIVLEIVKERETMRSLVERIKLEMLGTKSEYDPIVYYYAQTKIEKEKKQIDNELLTPVRKLLLAMSLKSTDY